MTNKEIFVKLETGKFQYCGYFTRYMNQKHKEERINYLKEKYPNTEIWIVEIKEVIET